MKLNEPGQIWKQQLNEPLWMNSSAVQEEMHQTKINSYCTALSSIKNQFLGPHKVMSSQVILQPSDLIILAIIEKATVLSGQKSKAEKTRKGKEGKKSREKERWYERVKRRKSMKCRLPRRWLLDLFSLSAILDHHWAKLSQSRAFKRVLLKYNPCLLLEH